MALKLDAKIPAGALEEKWSNHKVAIIVQKEPEDQGYFQCPEFRSVQFAVLWDPPGDRRLRDLHGGRLPGSGGADTAVFERM